VLWPGGDSFGTASSGGTRRGAMGSCPTPSSASGGPWEVLLAAAASRRGAVLLFEEGDPRRPLLMGLLEPESETPFLDEVLATPAGGAAKVAEVDGERVVIDGKREVVLRCGPSSIMFTRSLRIATSRGFTEGESSQRKEETEWHDIEVWDKRGSTRHPPRLGIAPEPPAGTERRRSRPPGAVLLNRKT